MLFCGTIILWKRKILFSSDNRSGSGVYNFVKPTLTVKINKNVVSVVPSPKSKNINTEKAAYSSATRIFEKIKTYLQI
jgi:hypothetical protein